MRSSEQTSQGAISQVGSTLLEAELLAYLVQLDCGCVDTDQHQENDVSG